MPSPLGEIDTNVVACISVHTSAAGVKSSPPRRRGSAVRVATTSSLSANAADADADAPFSVVRIPAIGDAATLLASSVAPATPVAPRTRTHAPTALVGTLVGSSCAINAYLSATPASATVPASVDAPVKRAAHLPAHVHSTPTPQIPAALPPPTPVSVSSILTLDDALAYIDELETEFTSEDAAAALPSPIASSASPLECTELRCMAAMDLCENLSLDVSEWSNRYDVLRAEGTRLFLQYEGKCTRLAAVLTRSHKQDVHIREVERQHEELRLEYAELYAAYADLERAHHARAQLE
jgi:hypothetical protein